MSDPLLSLEAVTVEFGGLKAVGDLSLGIGAGELVGLIGPVSYTHLTLPTIYSV